MTKRIRKYHGYVELSYSNDYVFLIMRGDYRQDQIVEAAINAGLIDDDERRRWMNAEYYQSHYKTVPAARNSEYATWDHPRDAPCRGSYFASVIQWG